MARKFLPSYRKWLDYEAFVYKDEGKLVFVYRTLPCIYAMEAFLFLGIKGAREIGEEIII